MARVVVLGGGLGGMAAAARLAKLKHQVTLVERSGTLGGALLPVRRDGFNWETVDLTLLPGALRDLFRKSGRPLEAELDLRHRPILREHRFPDGSALALPGSSRAAQLAAAEALGPGLGRAYVDHVATYTEAWETLRRHVFEAPAADPLPREVAAVMQSRETLHRRLRRSFADRRLRTVAAHPFVLDGHDPRQVPAWAGLTGYLEQRFGGWVAGADDATGPGLGTLLADALTRRLTTRRVEVLTGVEARDLVTRSGRVAAVSTTAGDLDADAVVVAIDPRLLPALAGPLRRSLPATPPTVLHLGLRQDPAARAALPVLEHETVLHGESASFTIRHGGQAPAGATAWTVLVRGKVVEDPVVAMARLGVDVRPHLQTRLDLTPRELVHRWHGSPLGVEWRGRGTAAGRVGPRTPIPGVFAAGASATSGTGLPFVALSAAVVAQLIGPA
ncbi:phytoene desaturase family protein [Nocardioides insulae]|uniref:phytoene desaturase family protein n=1 Tax=Nocardioides insulae TaxID=394734 RepID=UPI00041B9663|nr:FAD-dependent oxidoreductase [Nocardioides insulae]